MGAAEKIDDLVKQRRAKAITSSATTALTELLEPIIMRAVAEANDADPIIEITREQWPLRRILDAVRAGELGGISRIGRRYYARRSVVYSFVETHQIRVRRRHRLGPAPETEPNTDPPSIPSEPPDYLDAMAEQLYGRRRRR